MNEQSKRANPRNSQLHVGILLLALCIIGSPIIATAQNDALLQLEELEEDTELALYFAKASILASTATDVLINVHAMLEILGDVSSERTSHLIQAVSSIEDIPEPVAELSSIELTHALSSALIYIEMAKKAGQEAVDTTNQASIKELTRRAYAYLLAALGSDISGFGMAGIHQALEWLPQSALRISPGESIQQAIDLVLPGGTIWLSSGTYNLSSPLRIGKSLTLARDALDDSEVIIVGPSEDSSMYLGNDNSGSICTIRIQDVSISGGLNGVVVGMSGAVRWGDNTSLFMSRVRVSGATKSGINIVNSQASLRDCVVEKNDQFGILIPLEGSVDVSGGLITANGTQEAVATSYLQTAGVHAVGRASLSILDCTISENAGSGVHVGNSVHLNLIRNQIIGNSVNGLTIWDQATVYLQGNDFLNNTQFGIQFANASCPQEGVSSQFHAFTGSVRGWGNTFSPVDDENTHEDRSICPLAAYRYLLDSAL